MARHHCQHLASDIDQYTKSIMDEVVDKNDLKQEMVDKAIVSREIGRYSAVCDRQRRNNNRKHRGSLWIYCNFCQTLSSSAYGVWLFGSPWWQQEQNLQQKGELAIGKCRKSCN